MRVKPLGFSGGFRLVPVPCCFSISTRELPLLGTLGGLRLFQIKIIAEPTATTLDTLERFKLCLDSFDLLPHR